MAISRPPRITLAVLPTPLEAVPRLSAAWGGPPILVKRDDLTGFELSGNKVRKLEYHLAAALDAGASTVVTCGAIQSNHCRATALAAARVGLGCRLLLRTADGQAPPEISGNHLLHRLAGASIRYVTPAEYDDRDRLLAEEAAEIGGAWVIPEGASDDLGMWGFITAAEEIAAQIDGDVAGIWHASSSAGTTAGLAVGLAMAGVHAPVMACSVGDPADELAAHVEELVGRSHRRWGTPLPKRPPIVTDAHVGGGYGVTTREDLAVQAEATRLTGLLFDPTYTGKALVGLRREIRGGRVTGPVVFWHTGGGFAAFAADWPMPR
ncbi:MAG TPA: D-cysteine desulfhydrase family protein [Acidimicrobiia bacterium]|nr:D-cysteine desulfhydrase family protein [Acidimicrobiia bacterium]